MDPNNVYINEDAGIITIKNHGAIFATGKTSPALPQYDTLQRKESSSKTYKPWGTSDDYPVVVESKVRQHPFLRSVLNYEADAMAGGELQYGTESISETGETIFTRTSITEVEEFLTRNNIESFRLEVLRDLYKWNNAFVTMVRGAADRNKIVQLFALDAHECRYSWQNNKTGLKDYVYVDANFGRQSVSTPQKKIKLIDPYYWDYDAYRNDTAKQFAQPLYFASSGEKYYQRADWHSFIDSLWFDIVIKIAQFKSSVLDGMHLRLVVHIPDKWWEWKYPGFNDKKLYSPEAKKAVMQKEADYFDQVLSGADKAGKVLLATFMSNNMGKPETQWTVQVVDNKFPDGAYNEDSAEASLMMLFAQRVHGAVIGNTPGKSQSSSGSGSDIRVASNQFVLNNKVYDHKQLEPLRFITMFNKWTANDKLIKWRIVHQMIETSNNIPPEKRP